MTREEENRFQCVASLAQREIMRYSPAGIPIVTATLLHRSEQVEAGGVRIVELEISAHAAGDVAHKLEQISLGETLKFSGFMAKKNRNSKSLIFHLHDFKSIT